MATKVTIQDIASELQLSRNTVSKAINNTGVLADATREKILRKAAEMGYKQFAYLVIPRRRHPVMGAKRVIAGRKIRPRRGVEVAERRRQTVAAVLGRGAAQRPERVLKPLGQGDEALAAENDVGMLEARPRQPEVVEQMIQSLARNGHADRSHVRKIRQAEPTGLVKPQRHRRQTLMLTSTLPRSARNANALPTAA